MTQSFLHETSTLPRPELLAAFSFLCRNARSFYLHKAETTGSGNLRRQFSALAELHQQILYLLPRPQQSSKLQHITTALAELSHWYDNKFRPMSLSTIQQQLQKQLQLQKAMIRHQQLGQHQTTLLYFTASLQIAADQLSGTKPFEQL